MAPSRLTRLCAISMLVAAVSSPASAHSAFDAVALSDADLAAVRGTFSPSSFRLTIAQLRRIQDNVGQENFRLGGSVASTSMDSWWATYGVDLIAANVAVQAPRP